MKARRCEPTPVFVAALAYAIACIWGCSHGAESRIALNVPPAAHRIVVFGDSLALGVGASDSSRGFTFILYRKLLQRDPGAQITNYAVGGARVDDVLHYELPRAGNTAASDVWVCIGGNDVTHATSATRFATEYSALAHALRRRWPPANIVVFGVPDVSRSPLFLGTMRAQLRDLARDDNLAAQQAAVSVRAGFVDLFGLGRRVIAARDFSADNFHPSDAGYAAIAQAAEAVALPAPAR